MQPQAKWEILEQLRARLPQKEILSCETLEVGIPKGAITAVSGHGKTTFVAQLLASHKSLSVAWIEEKFSVFPIGLLQHGVELEKVLFVEAGKESEWATLQILKSQAFPMVVLYVDKLSIPSLRRIQLACEKSHSALIWLAPKAQKLWPIHMECHVQKTKNALSTRILKQRLS